MSVLLVVAAFACGDTPAHAVAQAATPPASTTATPPPARPPTTAEAKAALAAAAYYHAREQPRVEQRVLEALLRRLDPVTQQALTEDAERQLAAVREQQAEEPRPSGFLHDVGSAFSSAASKIVAGLLLLAVAILIVWLLWRAQRKWAERQDPVDELAVQLEDLTVASGERRDGNRRLGGEIEAAMRARLDGAAAGDDVVFEIDMTGDLDGSAALDVRVPGDELVLLEPYVGGITTVSFGPLSIDPRTLFSLLRGATARRSAHELRGTLTGGETLTLTVHLLSGDTTRRWTTSGRDRGTLTANLAERVAFELAGKPVSTSWESIEAYRSAERILRRRSDDAEARREKLRAAKSELERAIRHDPGNLLARYELGTVLRKLGMNEEAVAQLRALKRFADETTAPQQLLAAARYGEAIVLSKTTWPDHRRAIELFEALLRELPAPQTAGAVPPTRAARAIERRRAIVRSAWAAAKVFELEEARETVPHPIGEKRRREHVQELLGEIRAVRDDLDAIRTAEPADAVAFMQALVVAENAYGRGLHVVGEYAKAIDAFTRALALAPEFTDADVNIASTLLNVKQPAGWDERALWHLSRALDERPNDRKAIYLRAKLCLRLRQEDEARRWFERGWALGDRRVLPQLAELRWEDGGARRAEAIKLLERAIHGGHGAAYLQETMVRWVATLVREGGVTKDQLAAGQRACAKVTSEAERRGRPLKPAMAELIELIEARAGQPAGETGDDDRSASNAVGAPR